MLLVSQKAAPTALYKALSLRFKHRVAFAQAQGKVDGIKEAVGVELTPALAVVDDKATLHLYKGAFRKKRNNVCSTCSCHPEMVRRPRLVRGSARLVVRGSVTG